MKIVVAPDKFKNSLTGLEFCNAVEEGIKLALPKAEIIKLPLADGGDGTIDVVNYYLNGTEVKVTVNNPFFKPVKAKYLFSETSGVAFIEMAEASGVKLLAKKEFDCKNATTLGTGEMILDAIKRGASKIFLGIGGSATNDCGMGMATALGYKFLDKDNVELKPIGSNLIHVHTIDTSNVNPKLETVEFQIACDVTNPLYGSNGAAFIYAEQKGANQDDIFSLDAGLRNISRVIEQQFNINVQEIKGAGAAGGMGAGSVTFLKGQLISGIDLVMEIANFENKIMRSDWIITGEGRLDEQTFSGKAITGIVAKAKKYNIKVAAFCGDSSLDTNKTKALGIDYSATVMRKAKTFELAIKNAYNYLKEIAVEFTSYLDLTR